MAVRRPVLDVDLSPAEEKFKKFMSLYSKYEDKLAKIPSFAKGVKTESDATVKSVQALTAAMLANLDLLSRQKRTQNDVQNSARGIAALWASISRSTRETSSYLYRSVGTLMRWTGIGGAISGLALGGGVFGLDRLAASASAGRRSSMGLGLSYGEQTAFGVSYQRLIDSAAFLGGVSTGRGNVASAQAGALFSLGINPAGKGNTGAIANDALARIRQLALQTPEEHLGILQQSRGLDALGLSVEDLRRIKTLSNSEFAQYQSDYAKRAGQMEVGDPRLKAWQDFYVQLDAAGEKIKSALIGSLSQLAKPLEALSEALGDFLKSIIGSNGFKQVIDWVTEGLKDFAEYVRKDDFKNDVRTFVESVEMLAKKTVSALRWLGLIPDPNAASGAPNDPASAYGVDPGTSFMGPAPNASKFYGDPYTKGMNWLKRQGSGIGDFLRNPFGGSAGTSSPEMETYKKAVASMESGHSYSALGPIVKGDRAYGKYQVMGNNIPSWTQQALGRSMTPQEFLSNPEAQEKVFEKVFGDYVKKYGNVQDALSMWHSGLPLAEARRRGVADVNMTTVDYVNRISQNIPNGGGRVQININNNTGGNANVSASAMGGAVVTP